MLAQVKHQGIWVPWGNDEPLSEGQALALSAMRVLQLDLSDRLLVLPRSGRDESHPLLKRFGGPGRTVTPRTRNSVFGRFATVLAAYPDADALEVGVESVASGGTLAVLDWGDGGNEGWAAATRALNARTGERVPALDADLVATFDQLLFHDTEMSMGRTTRQGRTVVQPLLKDLKSAGLDFHFIASYCIASGFRASGTKRLREHFGEV